jgi:hypothetical protein
VFFAGDREKVKLDEAIPDSVKDTDIREIPLPLGLSMDVPDMRLHVLRAGHIMGGPVYWKGPEGAFLYNWSEDSELRAFAVDPTSATPVATSDSARFTGDVDGLGPSGAIKGHPGGVLSLSANGGEPGTGIVWASTYDAGDDKEGAIHKLKPGILRAFNAEDITQQLWSSNTPGNGLGVLAKFNPPTVAKGRVYMAAFGGLPELGRLKVYGLRAHRYLRPEEVDAVRWWQTMAPVRRP